MEGGRDPSPIVRGGFPASCESISLWLAALNLSKHEAAFERAGITAPAHLHDLSDDRLKAAGIEPVGHRTRILQAASKLVEADATTGLHRNEEDRPRAESSQASSLTMGTSTPMGSPGGHSCREADSSSSGAEEE